MSYKSILVNLDIDGPIVPIVKASADLAQSLQARLIGFCAADAALPVTGPGGEALAVEAWQEMRESIESRFKELRAAFDEAVAGSVQTDWREVLDSPTRALASASCMADLVVMRATEGAASGDTYRVAAPGSVVLQAGRPLLIVADGIERVPPGWAVGAWKETREARRAIADAVPLLAAAAYVTVVTVVEEVDEWVREGVADVAAFLDQHGIAARVEVIESSGDGDRLLDFVRSHATDLVVSGAYGHSRLREWAFGGVTRSLLDESRLTRFISN